MHNIYKFACITLGFGLITACDHEEVEVTPRNGSVDSIVCGGFLGLECPGDLICVDDPADDCDPQNGGADCDGICQDPSPTSCGGFGGIECPKGEVCVDDPADDCDPDNGGADCIGICEPAPDRIGCGGFAGIECPDPLICVDNPADDCFPTKGGADCSGICVPGPGGDDKAKTKPGADKCDDKDRDYVSKDPAQCAAILFFCPEGQSVFFDDCGCGCESA